MPSFPTNKLIITKCKVVILHMRIRGVEKIMKHIMAINKMNPGGIFPKMLDDFFLRQAGMDTFELGGFRCVRTSNKQQTENDQSEFFHMELLYV